MRSNLLLWTLGLIVILAGGCYSGNITNGEEARLVAAARLSPMAAGARVTQPALGLTDSVGVMRIAATKVAMHDLGILPTLTPSVFIPTEVNGVPLGSIILMSDRVTRRIREIYALGQSAGHNPHAFSKIGDSTIENPHFLTRFDGGVYNLGAYEYLQPVIDYFSGSFSRQGMAVQRGLHSWSVFDPIWADNTYCLPDETVIACEFRLHNPSLVFIRLGSNDVGVPRSFDENLRRIVEFSITSGVIPILGTKADRHEGADNINNTIIRQIAADYNIPLWDFDVVAQTLPRRGLDLDGVHMTAFYAHDYTLTAAFQRGHALHNLTALIALDKVWRTIMIP